MFCHEYHSTSVQEVLYLSEMIMNQDTRCVQKRITNAQSYNQTVED